MTEEGKRRVEEFRRDLAAKKERRARRRAEIMKAASHLNRSRMAWVIYRFISGFDLAGSSKGDLADMMIDGETYPGKRGEPTDEFIARVVSALIAQENTRGETGNLA